jgi:hypothetical protein
MTTKESRSRDSRTVQCIESMFRVHQRLRQYASTLQISIEDAAIVLRGKLPSGDLKADLLPAIRQAGFLGQVCDRVEVEAQAA